MAGWFFWGGTAAEEVDMPDGDFSAFGEGFFFAGDAVAEEVFHHLDFEADEVWVAPENLTEGVVEFFDAEAGFGIEMAAIEPALGLAEGG